MKFNKLSNKRKNLTFWVSIFFAAIGTWGVVCYEYLQFKKTDSQIPVRFKKQFREDLEKKPFISDITYSKAGINSLIHQRMLPANINCEVTDCESGLPIDSQLLISSNAFLVSTNYSTMENMCHAEGRDSKQTSLTGTEDGDPRRAQLKKKLIRSEMKELFTAWALFADEQQIPYWLSHNSLLGWHWGKKRMFWETYYRIQIPLNLMYELQDFSNQLLHNQYRFEINPQFNVRQFQSHNNVDAWFTDIKTGYYIEIKALSLIQTGSKSQLTDKSVNVYEFNHIFPLIRTTLDGIPTWRPSNTSFILEKEYGTRAIQSIYFDKYRFSGFRQEWIEMKTCQQLFYAYIFPRIYERDLQNRYPQYHWIPLKKETGKRSKCRVLEIDLDGKIRSIDAVWYYYEDLGRVAKEQKLGRLNRF